MMKSEERWLLPQGIEEALPEEAARLETLRRNILDMYACWGYQQVIPPIIEFLDSLLTGTGHDLDIQTFQLIDQITGKSLGIRADMTPQVARIDAHHLKQEISRLCYIGTVLHTRPDGFAGSRSPVQIGAEIYGHDGVESDAEIIELMLSTFAQAQVENIYLDIGHVDIFRSLSSQAGLTEAQENNLFDMLQRKALPEIKSFLQENDIATGLTEMLLALPELNGDVSVLDKAEKVLSAAGIEVKNAIDYLRKVSDILKMGNPELNVHFDLSELRGYHYHTGIIFAAYIPGQGQELARGGRYNSIGEVFGRSRPATGFSTDLKSLVDVSSDNPEKTVNRIFAPADSDNELKTLIASLRSSGECVICALPGQASDAKTMGCARIISKVKDKWQVVEAD